MELFTRYRIRDGALAGVSLGLGANYRDRAYLGAVNGASFYADSSLVWNSVIGYNGKWRGYDYTLNLNLNNVTDERYYTAYALNFAGWSNPRELRLSATLKF